QGRAPAAGQSDLEDRGRGSLRRAWNRGVQPGARRTPRPGRARLPDPGGHRREPPAGDLLRQGAALLRRPRRGGLGAEPARALRLAVTRRRSSFEAAEGRSARRGVPAASFAAAAAFLLLISGCVPPSLMTLRGDLDSLRVVVD